MPLVVGVGDVGSGSGCRWLSEWVTLGVGVMSAVGVTIASTNKKRRVLLLTQELWIFLPEEEAADRHRRGSDRVDRVS